MSTPKLRLETAQFSTRRVMHVLLALTALFAVGAVATPVNAASRTPSPLSPKVYAKTVQRSTPSSARVDLKEYKVDPTMRAMWVWTWDSNADVVNFAQSHQVREIYIYVFPGTARSAKVLDLAARTKAAGMSPWAMGGDPSWLVNSAVPTSWTKEVLAAGVFKGIHLELEPQQLADFNDNQTQYLSAMVTLVAKTAKASRVPVDVSLPWWYHTLPLGQGSATDALVAVADQVTIITYNNTTEGINDQAAVAAAVADKAGKPFRFASETNFVPDAPSWLSFAGGSNAQMLVVQDEVIAQWSTNPLFRGFSVHDYRGWVALS